MIQLGLYDAVEPSVPVEFIGEPMPDTEYTRQTFEAAIQRFNAWAVGEDFTTVLSVFTVNGRNAESVMPSVRFAE